MANTQLVWKTIGEKRFLKFIFNGYLSLEEATPAIAEWRKQFSAEVPEGDKVNIIWDCLEMSGFDPKVKNEWQITLKELSTKIQDIWIISVSPAIRIAALTMGLFSRYKIKTVIKESDIK